MKRQIATASLLFFATLMTASASAADLTIAVEGMANADGQLMVALYNSADAFPGKPFRVASAQASAGTVRVEIKDMPQGDYAFALYHDANGNGKLDRNVVGMPVEDYAFSNNALGKRGAPGFADARFQLPAAGAAVSVSLR